MAASVPRLFPGSTVVCLASGPSLTREDVAYCRGRAPVVAVNDTYRLAPWADVLYACDAKWWDVHEGAPGFGGLKYSLERRAEQWPGVQMLERGADSGLESSPDTVAKGGNSGHQAVNVAVHLGAARIVLLGYDMQVLDGRPSHFFGEHPPALKRDQAFALWIDHLASIVAPAKALGVRIVNCSRATAVTCFPRAPLAEAL